MGVAALGGLVGMKKPNNHGVPYSLTEEFVSVYRMHSLLPDQLLLRDVDAAPGPNKSPPLIEKYAPHYTMKQRYEPNSKTQLLVAFLNILFYRALV